MTRKLTINLIGPGKVGQTVCRCLVDQDLHTVQDVFGRDPDRAAAAAAFIGSGSVVTSMAAMRPADLWFITVPDARIGEVAEDLAGSYGHAAGTAVAIHFSGFLPADEMAALRRLNWAVVSAHPVLTFADPAIAAANFAGTYCGIEGDEHARVQVGQLLEGIGARTFSVTTEGKALYHAAAVLSSNFAVVLQAMAREAWLEAGVPGDVARELNQSMLKAVVENITALGPQGALTGPAARGDWSVVERQHEAVRDWHPEAGRAYESLSLMARRLKRHGMTTSRVDEEG
jgi:predicted short-subunit dehydrogenase-like oxidoreductase (DUF2520 family)